MKLMSVLHGQFSGMQVFTFVLYSSCEVRVLQWSRREVQSLGQRKDGISMSYFVLRISFDLKCVLFCWQYDFSVLWNTPFIIPDANHILLYKSQSQVFINFFGEWKELLPLTRSCFNDDQSLWLFNSSSRIHVSLSFKWSIGWCGCDKTINN